MRCDASHMASTACLTGVPLIGFRLRIPHRADPLSFILVSRRLPVVLSCNALMFLPGEEDKVGFVAVVPFSDTRPCAPTEQLHGSQSPLHLSCRECFTAAARLQPQTAFSKEKGVRFSCHLQKFDKPFRTTEEVASSACGAPDRTRASGFHDLLLAIGLGRMLHRISLPRPSTRVCPWLVPSHFMGFQLDDKWLKTTECKRHPHAEAKGCSLDFS
jgi:hypothetical protein